MPIVFHAGLDVQAYRDQFHQLTIPRPEQCPHCQAAGALIGHGCYPRKALDPEHTYLIRIRRWRCKACGKTVAMLPSFLLCFRHYLVVVIQAVVVSRHEQAQSWSQVEAQTSRDGAPSRRSLVRWCQSFAQHATAWLALGQPWLAEHDSASPWLDPLGEAASAGAAPRALLGAATHLLAWAQAHWSALRTHGLSARLSVLWQWGYTQGLPRLV